MARDVTPDADQPPIRYATASDGVRISYVHFPGSTPTFLVIRTPGAPPLSLAASMPEYSDALTLFRRGRSAVQFDWRGAGASDPISDRLRIEDLVSDLDAVISAVGGPVDAISWGRSWFATALHAAKRPDQYRSLRVGGAALRPGESWQGLYNRPGWQAHYSEHLQGLARHYFGASPEEAVRFALRWESVVPGSVFAAYVEAERDVDLTDVLPQIHIPTWVVAALPIDYEPAAKIDALLPNSARTIYDPEDPAWPIGDAARDEWDQHLGKLVGDSPSVSIASADPAGDANGDPIRFTHRQREVLIEVASGDTNRQIGVTLGIAEGTVKRHVSDLLHKTGLSNRRLLMRFADKNGFSD